ncbi:MAG: hypothetical protein PF444_01130 [Bacteroidales bacterium]|jgi:hypothetical protein|nr:hypothetical protein [Bacteroidales bacterium]
MLPAYPLVVDFIGLEQISEKLFRQQISQCLSDIEALSVLAGSKSYQITYYQPGELPYESLGGSWRFVAVVSIGKKRAEALLKVFQALVDKTKYDLPQYSLEASFDRVDFSYKEVL